MTENVQTDPYIEHLLSYRASVAARSPLDPHDRRVLAWLDELTRAALECLGDVR